MCCVFGAGVVWALLRVKASWLTLRYLKYHTATGGGIYGDVGTVRCHGRAAVDVACGVRVSVVSKTLLRRVRGRLKSTTVSTSIKYEW